MAGPLFRICSSVVAFYSFLRSSFETVIAILTALSKRSQSVFPGTTVGGHCFIWWNFRASQPLIVCASLPKRRISVAMKIPERYKAGLSLLASTAEDSYKEILEAAKTAPYPFANNKELSAWISSEVKSVPLGDVEKLVESLTSLHRLRQRVSVPISKLSEDAATAAREQIANFREEIGTNFKDRLASLIVLESLNVLTSKAKELQAESERLFCEARILTDIRPIFGDQIGTAPEAAIIVHTLKIGFHDAETSTHKEIFIALDNDDIGVLRKISERAEEKARILKSMLDVAKLRSVDLP